VDVKQQIQILIGLQDYDAQIIERNKRLKVLPERLKEMRADIQQLEAVVSSEREELDQQDRWKGEKEEEHGFMEAQITRIRQQMQGVRAHKEAMALQRQLEMNRKQLSELEDEILQATEALEQRRAAVEEHEASLKQLQDQATAEELEIKSEIETIQGELTKITEERDSKSVGLEKSVKKRYDLVASRLHPSVVEAIDGRCTGCNMALLPQLYNTLFYANSLEICPQCTRMIYLKAAVFEDEEDKGEAEE
jgi:predicted  nucleic acid-binding Zn-ribbon protein